MTTKTTGAPRAFPQAVEYERAVLGGLMQAPNKIPDVGELLTPGDFYRQDHGELYRLLLTMAAGGDQIDAVTVPYLVAQEDDGVRFGGVAYVADLPGHCPATANLLFYAREIQRLSARRRLIGLFQAQVEKLFEPDADPGAVGEGLHGAVAEVLDETRTVRRAGSLHDILVARVDELDLLRARPVEQRLVGVSWGLRDADGLTQGLMPGDLWVIAGRPGMGKTALLFGVLDHHAEGRGARTGGAVGLWEAEMSERQLADRYLADKAHVAAKSIRRVDISDEEAERMWTLTNQTRGRRYHVDASPRLTMSQVASRARRLKDTWPDLRAIGIDYLQILQPDNPRAPREQQVSAISYEAKQLAKELQVAVLLGSQLNRKCEDRPDRRPEVGDLRESGAIEQDADGIVLVYRPAVYWPTVSRFQGLAELIVAKNRQGGTGSCWVGFAADKARFHDLSSDQYKELPRRGDMPPRKEDL